MTISNVTQTKVVVLRVIRFLVTHLCVIALAICIGKQRRHKEIYSNQERRSAIVDLSLKEIASRQPKAVKVYIASGQQCTKQNRKKYFMVKKKNVKIVKDFYL